MSVNCGIERPVHFFVFAPGGGGADSGCPLCARPIGFPGVAKKAVSKSPYHIINCFGLLERRTTNGLSRLELISLLQSEDRGGGHVEGMYGLALGCPGGWERRNLPVIPTIQFPKRAASSRITDDVGFPPAMRCRATFPLPLPYRYHQMHMHPRSLCE